MKRHTNNISRNRRNLKNNQGYNFTTFFSIGIGYVFNKKIKE